MTPHEYQLDACRWLVNRLYVEGHRGAGLLADPGLGKTLMTLMLLERLRAMGEVRRALVVAPLRPVYSVWPQEIEKWGFDFPHTILHGPKKRRELKKPTSIQLINPEGLDWLSKLKHLPRWDMLVVDESTFFKTWMSKRSRAMRRLLKHFPRRLILTGTPSPNCYSDLHPQMYLLDDGEALGVNITVFRAKYMTKGGYLGRQWIFRPECAPYIERKIAGMCYRLDGEDHLDLPPVVHNKLYIDLPPDVRHQYNQAEQQLFLELDTGQTLTASNAGAKYAMCRGLASGGAYENEDQMVRGRMKRVRVATHHVHQQKVDAFAELVEELAGKPVLAPYQWDHDLERLRAAFPKSEVINGHISAKKSDEIIARWNDGKIHVLFTQPQALSHGVNMQARGNDIAWTSLPDRPEVYQQMNKRLHRQGVKGQVRIHHILARDTVDEAVLGRLMAKGARQQSLLDTLKRYRRGRV